MTAQSRGSPNVLFNIMFRTPTGYFPVIVTFFFPRDQAQFACLCTIGLNAFVQQPPAPPAYSTQNHISQDGMPFSGPPAFENPSFNQPPKTISPMLTISGGSSASSVDLLPSYPMNKISPGAFPTPPPSSSSSSSTPVSSTSSSTSSLPLPSRQTPPSIQTSAKGVKAKAKAPPRIVAVHQPDELIQQSSSITGWLLFHSFSVFHWVTFSLSLNSFTEFSSSSSSSPRSDNDPTFSESQGSGKADYSKTKLILKRPETKRPEASEDGAIRKKKKKKVCQSFRTFFGCETKSE